MNRMKRIDFVVYLKKEKKIYILESFILLYNITIICIGISSFK
jgi:hypothetical protein